VPEASGSPGGSGGSHAPPPVPMMGGNP
jgi:hypothetical protein